MMDKWTFRAWACLSTLSVSLHKLADFPVHGAGWLNYLSLAMIPTYVIFAVEAWRRA